MNNEPTVQQKKRWKAQVMAEHARGNQMQRNETSTVPGNRASSPVSANHAPSHDALSVRKLTSGLRPSATKSTPSSSQHIVVSTQQTLPEQFKRKERPPRVPQQPTHLMPGSQPSRISHPTRNHDSSGVRPSVSQDKFRSLAPIAGVQQPSPDQRKRYEPETSSPVQVTIRPQVQLAARLSPPPDRMLLVPSISYSATTSRTAAPKTFEIVRATPDHIAGPSVPKPLQRVRRIMTPPGSELSLEERMNNDPLDNELEIIPHMRAVSSESSRDKGKGPARASTSSDPVHNASAPTMHNSDSIMEEDDESVSALDAMQNDSELEEEATVLSCLPSSYAREKRRATPTGSVDRNEGRTTPRGCASSDAATDISLPVTASSSFMRGDGEQARSELEGFSTHISTSSPAQTQALILSAMLPDLSMEMDEKQEYIGGSDVSINGVHRELEAGAEFFP